MADKQYRSWAPRQGHLLPPSPTDWLPEDDLAYFILDLVEVLDIGPIEWAIRAKDSRGTRPYHPRMMLALLLYGDCIGVVSSRKIELATHRDIAFRVISGGCHPDHSVIAAFRQQYLGIFKSLFLQTVRLAQEAGMASLVRVALDGSKMSANASKHKAMSYERMLRAEAELEQEIATLLALAEQTDQQDNRRFGKACHGEAIPEELRRREERLKRIREAKAALEAEAAQAKAADLRQRVERQRRHAEQADDPAEQKRAATRAKTLEQRAEKLRGKDDDDEPPPCAPADDLPHHQVPTTPDGKPAPKAQRNFTDPDSRIMKRDGAYMQGYNGQAAVDEDPQIIVACAATNQAPDQQHLPALVEQTKENCGSYPDQLLGEAGYWDEGHVASCEQRGIEPYIATGRQKHGQHPPVMRGRIPKDLDAKGLMRRKLRTKKGRQIYARRKAIVEPVFGQIKEARGLRRFLLRGLQNVQAEWTLMCACHNLLKLYRRQLALDMA